MGTLRTTFIINEEGVIERMLPGNMLASVIIAHIVQSEIHLLRNITAQNKSQVAGTIHQPVPEAIDHTGNLTE